MPLVSIVVFFRLMAGSSRPKSRGSRILLTNESIHCWCKRRLSSYRKYDLRLHRIQASPARRVLKSSDLRLSSIMNIGVRSITPGSCTSSNNPNKFSRSIRLRGDQNTSPVNLHRFPKASIAGNRIVGSDEAIRPAMIVSTCRQSDNSCTPHSSRTDCRKQGAHAG